MPVALITGTRRGIGRGAALALADAGFDVALANHPADGPDGPDGVDDLAGLVAERGRDVLSLDLDLLDRERLRGVVREVVDAWGRIDVLFTNAHDARSDLLPLADVTIEDVEAHLRANTLGPLLLAMLVTPGMAERGSGTVIFRGSGIGTKDPVMSPGRGGWGIAAAVANGGLHRIAGVVHNEYGDRGVRAFTLLPGYVLTDIPPQHRALDAARLLPGRRQTGGVGVVPEEAVARVITWLATSVEAGVLAGGVIDAAHVAVDRGLHPPWDRDGD